MLSRLLLPRATTVTGSHCSTMYRIGLSSLFVFLLFAATGLSGAVILLFRNRELKTVDNDLKPEANPLEFRTALVFTALFVLLSVVTYLVANRFGTQGMNLMSYLVGLVDIDPFLISLFAGKFEIGMDQIVIATLQAMVSNNIVKLGYAMFFGGKRTGWYVTVCFVFVILLNFLFILIV